MKQTHLVVSAPERGVARLCKASRVDVYEVHEHHCDAFSKSQTVETAEQMKTREHRHQNPVRLEAIREGANCTNCQQSRGWEL